MNTYCCCTDIRRLPPVADVLARTMPPERANALRAYHRKDDKLRCLAGLLLMEHALGTPAVQRIAYGPQGKPYLPGGPFFNLSHAGRYAVLAVGDAPVGIDVEQQRKDEHCAALAAVAFHPAEQAYYARHASVQTFFDIWTLKESYLKLLGTGLSLEPSSFALTFESGAARLETRPDLSFHLYNDLPGYSLALCLAGDDAPKTIVPIFFDSDHPQPPDLEKIGSKLM